MTQEPKVVRFEKCHSCGGTEFVAKAIGERMIKEGKFSPGRKVGVDMMSVVMKDPSRVGFLYPVVNVLMDICKKCGAYGAREYYESDVTEEMLRRAMPQALSSLYGDLPPGL